jgi:hypothetical protein
MGLTVIVPCRWKARWGFFRPENSEGFGRVWTRELRYQRPARKPLDHRSRFTSCYIPYLITFVHACLFTHIWTWILPSLDQLFLPFKSYVRFFSRGWTGSSFLVISRCTLHSNVDLKQNTKHIYCVTKCSTSDFCLSYRYEKVKIKISKN